MTAKLTRTKARACRGKKAHRTEEDALAHRQRLVAAGAAANAHDVYPCRRHGDLRWHVGHRPPPLRRGR